MVVSVAGGRIVARWGGRVMVPGRRKREVIVWGRKGWGERRESCQLC